MRIPRIYTPQSLQADQEVMLDETAAHYLGKVLRMQAGRPLVVFNGEGGEYPAEILAINKKTVSLQLGAFLAEDRESPLDLELAIGVSRGERMDWVLQKATELGVTRITPLLTERTEVKLGGERAEKKLAHWQHILISACEQCQRNRLPTLQAPQTLSDWLPQVTAEQRFVLHHRDSQRLPADAKPTTAVLLVGPEGGLSEEEIAAAQTAKFAPLTLGPRVLRTETAPVAAISLVQYLWGDF